MTEPTYNFIVIYDNNLGIDKITNILENEKYEDYIFIVFCFNNKLINFPVNKNFIIKKSKNFISSNINDNNIIIYVNKKYEYFVDFKNKIVFNFEKIKNLNLQLQTPFSENINFTISYINIFGFTTICIVNYNFNTLIKEIFTKNHEKADMQNIVNYEILRYKNLELLSSIISKYEDLNPSIIIFSGNSGFYNPNTPDYKDPIIKKIYENYPTIFDKTNEFLEGNKQSEKDIYLKKLMNIIKDNDEPNFYNSRIFYYFVRNLLKNNNYINCLEYFKEGKSINAIFDIKNSLISIIQPIDLMNMNIIVEEQKRREEKQKRREEEQKRREEEEREGEEREGEEREGEEEQKRREEKQKRIEEEQKRREETKTKEGREEERRAGVEARAEEKTRRGEKTRRTEKMRRGEEKNVSFDEKVKAQTHKHKIVRRQNKAKVYALNEGEFLREQTELETYKEEEEKNINKLNQSFKNFISSSDNITIDKLSDKDHNFLENQFMEQFNKSKLIKFNFDSQNIDDIIPVINIINTKISELINKTDVKADNTIDKYTFDYLYLMKIKNNIDSLYTNLSKIKNDELNKVSFFKNLFKTLDCRFRNYFGNLCLMKQKIRFDGDYYTIRKNKRFVENITIETDTTRHIPDDFEKFLLQSIEIFNNFNSIFQNYDKNYKKVPITPEIINILTNGNGNQEIFKTIKDKTDNLINIKVINDYTKFFDNLNDSIFDFSDFMKNFDYLFFSFNSLRSIIFLLNKILDFLNKDFSGKELIKNLYSLFETKYFNLVCRTTFVVLNLSEFYLAHTSLFKITYFDFINYGNYFDFFEKNNSMQFIDKDLGYNNIISLMEIMKELFQKLKFYNYNFCKIYEIIFRKPKKFKLLKFSNFLRPDLPNDNYITEEAKTLIENSIKITQLDKNCICDTLENKEFYPLNILTWNMAYEPIILAQEIGKGQPKSSTCPFPLFKTKEELNKYIRSAIDVKINFIVNIYEKFKINLFSFQEVPYIKKSIDLIKLITNELNKKNKNKFAYIYSDIYSDIYSEPIKKTGNEVIAVIYDETFLDINKRYTKNDIIIQDLDEGRPYMEIDFELFKFVNIHRPHNPLNDFPGKSFKGFFNENKPIFIAGDFNEKTVELQDQADIVSLNNYINKTHYDDISVPIDNKLKRINVNLKTKDSKNIVCYENINTESTVLFPDRIIISDHIISSQPYNGFTGVITDEKKFIDTKILNTLDDSLKGLDQSIPENKNFINLFTNKPSLSDHRVVIKLIGNN